MEDIALERPVTAQKIQLESSADSIVQMTGQATNPFMQFRNLWIYIIKPILFSTQTFTDIATDEQMHQLVIAADLICNSTNPDFSPYCIQWSNSNIKELLKMVQCFTMPKASLAISKFMLLSDNLCF